MTESPIVVFLKARYDEDEHAACAQTPGVFVATAPRAIRDIEAKRKILKEHNPFAWSSTNQNRFCPSCAEDTHDPHWPYERVLAPCDTLKLLALPYSDHEDYPALVGTVTS